MKGRYGVAICCVIVGGAATACGSDGSRANVAGSGGAPLGNAGTVTTGAGGGVAGSTQSAAGGAASGGTMGTGNGGVPASGGTSTGSGGIVTSAGGASGGGTAGTAAGGMGGSAGGGTGNCGMRTGMRGKTIRKLMVGSANRSYVAYLPQNLDPTKAVPFVYVFHGASQNGSWLYDATEYSKIADSDGIAVVFPDGQGASSQTMTGSLTPWNVSDNGAGLCGLGTLVSNANPIDLAFVDAIKADMKQDQCIDDAHVYATGFSMGGYFSHHIACDRPDFRATGPHSGGTIASLDGCKTTRKPIIIFHGTSDPLINNACDDPTVTPQAGFPASATLWAKRNGCKDTYQTVPTNGAMGNGQCYLYDGCPDGGQVEVCTFTNMAHAWAGAPVCQGCIGSGTGWASATQLEWQFFKKYAW